MHMCRAPLCECRALSSVSRAPLCDCRALLNMNNCFVNFSSV